MAIQDVIRMLEQERNRIDAAIKALKGVGVDSTASATKAAKTKGRKKRRISAEARVKMAEAARKRWAAKKAAEKKAVAKKTVTK